MSDTTTPIFHSSAATEPASSSLSPSSSLTTTTSPSYPTQPVPSTSTVTIRSTASTDAVTGSWSYSSSSVTATSAVTYPTEPAPSTSTVTVVINGTTSTTTRTLMSTDPVTGTLSSATDGGGPPTTTTGGASICYPGYGTESVCFPVEPETTTADTDTVTGSMTTFMRAYSTDSAFQSEDSGDSSLQEEGDEHHHKHPGWGWFNWGKREDEKVKH
ncbi:hypothetical protein UCREL1_5948 [Eutypa lata UCREL1]|uniref:Uncharacterized protein n=1 Tax=Eutypa lata (strain UCR-EL1) TaxID=1287681 RepID=M7SRD6_EUTLA|nr:hypothetical protein UCREL1_5948 [Eutypa lata UCREL1]